MSKRHSVRNCGFIKEIQDVLSFMQEYSMKIKEKQSDDFTSQSSTGRN
jgi:hypothetical protein